MTVLLWGFNVVSNDKRYLGLKVKCPIFCPIVTKCGLSRQIFLKPPDIKISR